MSNDISLHPAIDGGLQPGSDSFTGGTLTCNCTEGQVSVKIDTPPEHNHLCGCTQCWKPEGARFSILAVVPRDKLSVTRNEDKLGIVDPQAVIQRHACNHCGAHLYGRIEDTEHPFHGLDFIHPELFTETGWPEPQFAAFVSSVIEGGTPPGDMDKVRSRLRGMHLEPYDCLSPELMDLIATHAAKASGALNHSG